MKNSTTELIKQITSALDTMDLQAAIRLLGNALPAAAAVYFYSDLQTTQTDAGRVHICLQYVEAVQS